MSAGARLRRHVRRLALVTCAVGVVAALSSGPALADPGLSSLVTGITGPLPSELTKPVDDVGAAVDPVLDQVQGQVDATTASVDETVDKTTEVVDVTVSGAAPVVEQTVDGTLGAAGDTLDTLAGSTSAPPPSPAPASPSTDARAADAPTAPVVHTPAPAATPTGAPLPAVPFEPAVLPGERELATLLRFDDLRPATVRPSSGSPTLSETTFPATRLARGVDSPSVTERQGQAIAGDAARSSGTGPARPLPLPDGDSLLFGWLSEPLPAAPLLAALLALLALAAPLAGGRRLHPAVALLRPTDVRFRLVRPG